MKEENKINNHKKNSFKAQNRQGIIQKNISGYKEIKPKEAYNKSNIIFNKFKSL